MTASYDVTFVPMTNVVIDTDNPYNLSEEQQTEIARLSADKIAESLHEKINCENLAEIRLYEIDGKETSGVTVFDNGCLRQSSNPIDEALRLLTDLAGGSYIPFASPSPSSTESMLKHCVLSAISLLETARRLEKDLGYRK